MYTYTFTGMCKCFFVYVGVHISVSPDTEGRKTKGKLKMKCFFPRLQANTKLSIRVGIAAGSLLSDGGLWSIHGVSLSVRTRNSSSEKKVFFSR